MKTIMDYFEDICAIPHVSGHEKEIADYVESFAAIEGLTCIRDSLHNLIVTKPATAGYENAPGVMLQGHLDMIAAKKSHVTTDMLTEPIKLIREGDILRADGTTLGADDGVAVAYMLAILADKTLNHPRLECVFTVQEEVGLIGASALDVSSLHSKYMINMDAGPEGVFLVSCAGGCRVKLSRKLDRETVSAAGYKIKISGLKGGSSGMDIGKERANANVIMATILDSLRDYGLQLVSIVGGGADNAIPSEASATFVLSEKPDIESISKDIKHSWKSADPNIEIELSPATANEVQTKEALTKDDSNAVIDLMLLLPHGISYLSADMPGLIQTSTNFAAVTTGDNLEIKMSLRSSDNFRKAILKRKVELIARIFGATMEVTGEYSGWEYEKDSPLLDKAVGVFRALYGKEPSVEGLHAGLECGVIKNKMPHLNILAMGPEYRAMHTADEWLNIPSFYRFYEFLLKLLEAIK